MAQVDLTSPLLLHGEVPIPRIGLGVYQARPGRDTERAVRHALRCGYRHIDTARAYCNEEDVGRAIRASGVPREEIFITTKLWKTDHGYRNTMAAFETSRAKLGVDYVDLYLIHWPGTPRRGDSWRALERLRLAGRCRAIGVSNYTVRHLEELLAEARVPPAVNQVELSPFLQQRTLTRFCRARGIVIEAYGPLTQGQKLGHPVLRAIARKHGRSPAQILIRWALEGGHVVLPKSVRPTRISENFDVLGFGLDRVDRERLGRLEEGFRTSWNPTRVP